PKVASIDGPSKSAQWRFFRAWLGVDVNKIIIEKMAKQNAKMKQLSCVVTRRLVPIVVVDDPKAAVDCYSYHPYPYCPTISRTAYCNHCP
uniref:Uncharacterized protein n=1 Tax=Romanomermis culicivorax TaxID=13658 RepID=A0A915HVF7_ROMCU